MIEIRNPYPKNRAQFSRLLAFCKEVLTVCDDLEIVPLLSGSLAVFAYTQNEALAVNDIDLACSQQEFPRLGRALDAHGIASEVREWHVLQVRRGDLKVEFDSLEYWMAGLPEGYETFVMDGCRFRMVGLPALRELYRRGLEATAAENDAGNRAKHLAIREKYQALYAL